MTKRAILVLIAIPLPRRLGRPKSDEGGSKAKTGLPRRSLAKAGPASCFTLYVKELLEFYTSGGKSFVSQKQKMQFLRFFYAGWMPRGFKSTFNHE